MLSTGRRGGKKGGRLPAATNSMRGAWEPGKQPERVSFVTITKWKQTLKKGGKKSHDGPDGSGVKNRVRRESEDPNKDAPEGCRRAITVA